MTQRLRRSSDQSAATADNAMIYARIRWSRRPQPRKKAGFAESVDSNAPDRPTSRITKAEQYVTGSVAGANDGYR